MVGPFDAFCAYERREGRHGLLLLLLTRGKPVAFVKAIENDSDGALDRELAALRLLEASDLASFVAPRVLGDGTEGDDGTAEAEVATTPTTATTTSGRRSYRRGIAVEGNSIAEKIGRDTVGGD